MLAAPRVLDEKPIYLPLRVQRLSSVEALGTLASEWGELEAGLSIRTPFTGLLWNQLWWKHYASRSLMVEDELFLHAVRDGGGRLMAIAPMMLTRRPSVGPVKARVLQCFGADINVTEVRGLVCQPRHQGAVLRALLDHFSRQGTRWDWIDWGGVREDGTGHEPLAAAGVIGWERQIPSYFLPLAPTWEEFRGRLSRNIKESLRKCYNSLKRAGHSFTLKVVESPEEAPAALQTFLRLHRERARSDARVKHTDVFAKPKDQAFLTEYVQRMAERGQLRLFQLVISGRVVATRVGFLFDDQLYLYYSGYDMQWASFSVMTTLLAEAIKWAIGQGLRIVSLSTGTDVAKLRWGPSSVVYRGAMQVAPGWQSELAFKAYRQVLQARGQDSPVGRLLVMTRR